MGWMGQYSLCWIGLVDGARCWLVAIDLWLVALVYLSREEAINVTLGGQ
jgi:hypothetical protein